MGRDHKACRAANRASPQAPLTSDHQNGTLEGPPQTQIGETLGARFPDSLTGCFSDHLCATTFDIRPVELRPAGTLAAQNQRVRARKFARTDRVYGPVYLDSWGYNGSHYVPLPRR
jgi:hypothetical protein